MITFFFFLSFEVFKIHKFHKRILELIFDRESIDSVMYILKVYIKCINKKRFQIEASSFRASYRDRLDTDKLDTIIIQLTMEGK